uniref:Uncharacterized protein n=1 Tax=Amphimedon queenslandica TaxID=400682 RepID=A0A1X7UGD6_AMPQE
MLFFLQPKMLPSSLAGRSRTLCLILSTVQMSSFRPGSMVTLLLRTLRLCPLYKLKLFSKLLLFRGLLCLWLHRESILSILLTAKSGGFL